MHRSARYFSVALLAAVLTAGCDSNTPTTPTDTTPPPTVTESFSDSVNPNGAKTHQFSVSRAGTVTLTLTALSPEGATVGLSLGTWNPTTSICQVLLPNDNAKAGATVIGTASSTGTFCARVYDVGQLTQTASYDITVTHF